MTVSDADGAPPPAPPPLPPPSSAPPPPPCTCIKTGECCEASTTAAVLTGCSPESWTADERWECAAGDGCEDELALTAEGAALPDRPPMAGAGAGAGAGAEAGAGAGAGAAAAAEARSVTHTS
jgi:hypothetical protein